MTFEREFLRHAIYAANEAHIGGITTCATVKVLLYKIFIYSFMFDICVPVPLCVESF